MPTRATFRSQLAAARRGDAAAWDWLYAEHTPGIVGYLLAQSGDVDDLLSDTWLAAVRDLAQFSGGSRDFHRWLVTIAKHRVIDHARYRTRRPSAPADVQTIERYLEPVDGPEAATEAAADIARVLAVLPKLSDDQRTIIELRFLAELTVAETAQITGKKPNAVRQTQHRALAALRRELELEP